MKGWFARKFARLSTGLKMLLILNLGLFPLGLVALFTSIESARDNSAKRAEQSYSRLDIKARRLDELLTRSSDMIRAASVAVALTPTASGVCEQTIERLARAQAAPGRYALYGGANELRCASPGFMPPATPNPGGETSVVSISEDAGALRLTLFDSGGRLEGIAEFPRQSLARLTRIPGTMADFDLELLQQGRKMLLRDNYNGNAFVETVQATAPVAGDRLRLRITLSAIPISPVEILTILLPIMMWIAATVIGWLIVNRLLLRPLVRMQRAVAAYKPGDQHLALPILATPAREIKELGLAFDQVTQTVARHEAELEAAIERQTRLVREVHHRVKNNLQVVASLLNLHSRGSANEEVAAAYASIQRRVDALAVVHRNHYAELEENRGVALKPLISELGANLRATAPASATHMTIRIDIDSCNVTQDVAVSVAFLITEVVEFAMLRGARFVAISLAGSDSGRSALLTMESDSLQGEVDRDEKLADRFERIVTGLARQLRSTVERDTEAGRYSLAVAVIDQSARRMPPAPGFSR